MAKTKYDESGSRLSLVYVLQDPRDMSIRYVGKSARSLQTRFDEHYSDATVKMLPGHRNNWIRALDREGLVPLVEVIDEGIWSLQTLNDREKHWISHLGRSGVLTNMTPGGDGQAPNAHVNAETRQKVGAKSQETWRREEYRKLRSDKQAEYWSGNDRARNAVSRQTAQRWADPNSAQRRVNQRVGICQDCGRTVRGVWTVRHADTYDHHNIQMVGGEL